MKKIKRIFILSLLILASMLYADQRDEPVDVIVALDKSLSMEEEIEAVKDYVNTYLIDQLLIPGDYFLTVAFYGQTEIPVSLDITGDEDKVDSLLKLLRGFGIREIARTGRIAMMRVAEVAFTFINASSRAAILSPVMSAALTTSTTLSNCFLTCSTIVADPLTTKVMRDK